MRRICLRDIWVLRNRCSGLVLCLIKKRIEIYFSRRSEVNIMADNIKDYQMSDSIWKFVYPYDGKERTNQEKQQEEVIRQKQSLELMHQYQQYYEMFEQNKYVLRESVISCQYGTKYAKLDCEEDHGVYKHMKPVMAITDCANNNIHNFGSCLCPEANYVGRLPMTNEVDNMGVPAIKASQNKRAHICVPIISENSVWHQVDSNALIGVKQKGYAPMLLDNAVLVCQYGGIIRIEEVPKTRINCSDYGVNYALDEEEKIFISVIAAESIGEGKLAWEVVANVIINRVGQKEWKSLTTVKAVVQRKGDFSSLNNGGSAEYHKAMNYLTSRIDNNNIYEQLIAIVMPVYHSEVGDITGGAQLYYSPKSMVPVNSIPRWASYYKKINVNGINSNEFVLFTGDRIK